MDPAPNPASRLHGALDRLEALAERAAAQRRAADALAEAAAAALAYLAEPELPDDG